METHLPFLLPSQIHRVEREAEAGPPATARAVVVGYHMLGSFLLGHGRRWEARRWGLVVCDESQQLRSPRVRVAVGETVILLHPPLHFSGVSIRMERGCQQNDSLANG